ncbi:MAG TPA: S-methyl-5'-thioadenosine phosphorylase [Acidimicrobiales bacterium]|nr:S-methyl-5'-thioadenosine phosphorylase [Acidimicrobiales bacterium]
MPDDLADVAVIGGSGFYDLLEDASEYYEETPYGFPSGPITIGAVAGRRVAFLARHGPRHELPPHKIPYRANLWSIRELGATRVLAPCAVGSLRPHIHPGHFVVCDQFVDRTWGRPDTFFDGPMVNHVSLADPYCPDLGAAATAALLGAGSTVHETGTVVVIQGPRFSTRAESAWYRSAGWDVINMTQYPEAALARELGLCYSSLALVTDYDTGVEGEPSIDPVSMDSVFAVLREMVDTVRGALAATLSSIPAERHCRCADGLTGGPLERRQ